MGVPEGVKISDTIIAHFELPKHSQITA